MEEGEKENHFKDDIQKEGDQLKKCEIVFKEHISEIIRRLPYSNTLSIRMVEICLDVLIQNKIIQNLPVSSKKNYINKYIKEYDNLKVKSVQTKPELNYKREKLEKEILNIASSYLASKTEDEHENLNSVAEISNCEDNDQSETFLKVAPVYACENEDHSHSDESLDCISHTYKGNQQPGEEQMDHSEIKVMKDALEKDGIRILSVSKEKYLMENQEKHENMNMKDMNLGFSKSEPNLLSFNESKSFQWGVSYQNKFMTGEKWFSCKSKSDKEIDDTDLPSLQKIYTDPNHQGSAVLPETILGIFQKYPANKNGIEKDTEKIIAKDSETKGCQVLKKLKKMASKSKLSAPKMRQNNKKQDSAKKGLCKPKDSKMKFVGTPRKRQLKIANRKPKPPLKPKLLSASSQGRSSKFRVKGGNLKGGQPNDSDNSGGGSSESHKSFSNKKEQEKEKENEKEADEQEKHKQSIKSDDSLSSQSNLGKPANSIPVGDYGVEANFKYKKKDMAIFLSSLKVEDAIPPDIKEEVNKCVTHCLVTTHKQGITDKSLECDVCVYVYSVLRHYGCCNANMNECTICGCAFKLILQHFKICQQQKEEDIEPCPVYLCRKVNKKFKILKLQHKQVPDVYWFVKLRKYLQRISEGGGLLVETEVEEGLMSLMSIPSFVFGKAHTNSPPGSINVKRQRITLPSASGLPQIPERGVSDPIGWKSASGKVAINSDTLPRRLQKHLDQDVALSFPALSDQRSSSENVQIPSFQPWLQEATTSVEPSVPAFTTHAPSIPKREHFLKSLPVDAKPPQYSEQLLSMEDRPTGIKGINEVVYGTRDQMIVVSKYWEDVKEKYLREKVLSSRHVREEGVILKEFEELFEIFHTRYQKNYQWLKIAPLGAGVSGKCQLANDYNTDYRFCVKKIHLTKFEASEIDIWAGLKHRNIVKFHGAIRHGIKIYIFAEFIDGGCLTEAINQQKVMQRRLSQWTALTYFKQIMKALRYLSQHNIVHEDIKADNILLREGRNDLVITDFGVARRVIHWGGKPIGTPTHFSPEKAKCIGHGSKADVWAAACVLIHIFSGSPPWIKRFPNLSTLSYVIVENDPPVKDLPPNISKDVRDLIEYCLTKDQNLRPTAKDVLNHQAFSMLANDPNTLHSVLMTSVSQLPDTKLPEYNKNVDEEVMKVLDETDFSKKVRRQGLCHINELELSEYFTPAPQHMVAFPLHVEHTNGHTESSDEEEEEEGGFENQFDNTPSLLGLPQFDILGVSNRSRPVFNPDGDEKHIQNYLHDESGNLEDLEANKFVNNLRLYPISGTEPVQECSKPKNVLTTIPNFGLILDPQKEPTLHSDLAQKVLSEALNKTDSFEEPVSQQPISHTEIDIELERRQIEIMQQLPIFIANMNEDEYDDECGLEENDSELSEKNDDALKFPNSDKTTTSKVSWNIPVHLESISQLETYKGAIDSSTSCIEQINSDDMFGDGGVVGSTDSRQDNNFTIPEIATTVAPVNQSFNYSNHKALVKPSASKNTTNLLLQMPERGPLPECASPQSAPAQGTKGKPISPRSNLTTPTHHKANSHSALIDETEKKIKALWKSQSQASQSYEDSDSDCEDPHVENETENINFEELLAKINECNKGVGTEKRFIIKIYKDGIQQCSIAISGMFKSWAMLVEKHILQYVKHFRYKQFYFVEENGNNTLHLNLDGKPERREYLLHMLEVQENDHNCNWFVTANDEVFRVN